MDHLMILQDENLLISYKGPVTPNIMAEISKDIRGQLDNFPQASRKIFSIFIELAQNILFYSAEKIRYAGRTESVGILQLSETANSYIFSCGNIVYTTDVGRLADSCNTINSLDREELRRLKRIQRRQPQSDQSKGAGIGLVQAAILSNNPLDIEVYTIDERHSFFSLFVTIDKE
ncbi:MAG: SiaB family protein kinase [Cyclobacteriaceae bacterium]